MTGAEGDAAVLLRACILGLFGGAALVLTHTYSRRGPMLYLVYAGILAATVLMLAQSSPSAYRLRFLAVLLAVSIATCMSLIRVLIVGARQRRRMRDLPVLPGGAPWWAMPFVATCLVVVSAGAALILR